MGQPSQSNVWELHTESIGVQSERGEVKYLSTPRKKSQVRDFLSSDERKGKSLNRLLH